MNRLHTTLVALALLVPALGLAPVPAAAQAQRPEDIQYPALPDFKLPKPERHVLPNGIVLLLAEDHELPLVRANVLIRTGSRLEAAEQAGLADLVGQTLRSGGTRNLTGDQIDEFLDGKGASVETSIDVNQGQASVFALKEDFPEVFRLFGEILRYPVFDPAKIDIAKTGVKGDIARQNDDPQDILYRELPELVYGAGSPYARQATYASLDAIEQADLVEFHRQYFQPTRLIIGVVGDFDAAAMRKLVTDTLGDWQATLPAGDPNMFSTPKPAAGIYFIEKSDVTQSSIGMGDLGIVRRHPDYFAVEVMNQVLSGSFTSRLFSEVRTKKGLAYNVSGFVGADWDKPGLTVLATSTKAETTGAAIDALLLEARRMKTEPPSDDEVAKAKRSILSSFIFQIDTPQKLLNQQLNYEYYGYPADWLEQYRLRIEKVTTAEVRDAAVKHLVPERFAILVVGPKEGRDTDLTKYGTVQSIDITIQEPNAPKLALTPEGQARAKVLLEAAVNSLGGAPQVDGVKTLRAVAKAVQTLGGQTMEATITATSMFPDHFRQEISSVGGEMVVAASPTGAFMKSPQGTLPLPGSAGDDMRRDFRRHFFALIKARNGAGFQATAAGTGDVDGTAVERVQIDYDGDVTTLSIDPKTGRILESSYQGSGPGGAPGTITQRFTDFRPASGLVLPHRTISLWNGQPGTDVELTAVEVNPAVDPKAFEP